MSSKKSDVKDILQAVLDTTNDALKVNIVASAGAGGLATEATLLEVKANTLAIDGKTPTLVAGRQPVDGSGVTQPISAVSLPLPTGAAQEHTTAASPNSVRLSTGVAFYNATTPADTQPVSVASLPLPTGAATETTLAALNTKVTAVNTGAVVVSSSVLPTGASTAANQATGNVSLASIDGKLSTQTDSNFGAPSVNTQRVAAMLGVSGAAVTAGNPIPVSVGSQVDTNINQVGAVSVQTNYGTPGTGTIRVAAMLGVGTEPVSSTNPVYTGATFVGGMAIQVDYGNPNGGAARVAAMLGVGNAIASSDVGTTGANTLRTAANLYLNGTQPSTDTGPSNATTLRVVQATGSNKTSGSTIYQALVYSASALTTSYTTALPFIDASTTLPTNINAITVFSSTGTALKLTWGGATPTNTNTLIIPPGGIDFLAVSIPVSSDIRISSFAGTSTGDVIINFLA